LLPHSGALLDLQLRPLGRLLQPFRLPMLGAQ